MNYHRNPEIISLIRRALKEDIGKRDITTELIIPKDKIVKAVLLAKENCVICGLDIAKLVFKTKDRKIRFKSCVLDGRYIKKGGILARIQGNARSILTSERVALNFLALLSGIATKTKKYAEKVKPYKVKIMDTRKTIPVLRELEKYAVRTGGGYNHRMRLDEMVLIKDNHFKVLPPKRDPDKVGKSSKFKVQSLIKKNKQKNIKVEIEVKNLKEFKEALKLKPDIIMLDNMSIKDMKKAVKIRNYRLPITDYQLPKLEASGGINLQNVRKIAACGVDMISIGDLTHSVNSIDMSLEII